MAGLSLQGYEAGLIELADPSKMTDSRLEGHIRELTDIYRQAVASNIGRQAEVATRLLIHFQFEQSQRAGGTANDFEAIISAQDFSGSPELADSAAA